MKMKLRRYPNLFLFALILLAGENTASVVSQAAVTARGASPSESKALSIRVVAYQLDARLDPAKKTLDATETLTYHNLTGQPQQTFPFHLYLNAFQPQSTFMTEVRSGGTRGTGTGAGWDPKHYGAEEITSLVVDGMGDLTKQMQFIQPDDRNASDHTVAQITLPKPVAPNADVTFRIAFHDQLPEVVERTGYKRDFFMIGQWFPKVGVWWHGAWNCHQFHATTEFFADFGTFDVKVTVPRNYLLGAAGDEISSENNPDGTKTVAYHSQDVHDFSWTASPEFTDLEDSWNGSAGPVNIHLLMSPGHLAQAGRYLRCIKGTLETFQSWYGVYPYDRITVVDPPQGASDAGGMEYPTLITGDSGWFIPRGLKLVEIVTEHEFGHQYWYGMVATNEFEEAWLDEGINSYTEANVMGALYGKNRSAINIGGATLSDAELQRLNYTEVADTDPLTRFAYKFMDSGSYGGITYGKTATVLLTLEGLIGEDVMRNAMHTYFERYKFTHPTGTDFLKTIQDVAGQDLSWYFNQAVSGTNVLDYEVSDVRSDRADWYEKDPPPYKKGQTVFRDTVLIHRKGDFLFPVETEVRFDNGEAVREKWDGKDRWTRYVYLKKAKILSAEIDPDHKVLLDKDYFNNSRTAESDSGATHKLQTCLLFLTELFSQLVAWIV
ncbi:MAG TPA: M1 family metallopeptidase [Terriglobia bacterium]|nr:M1 family metallopeptidase [Terriglobia bacterium]